MTKATVVGSEPFASKDHYGPIPAGFFLAESTERRPTKLTVPTPEIRYRYPLVLVPCQSRINLEVSAFESFEYGIW